MANIAVVDIGTSRIKAALIDEHGQLKHLLSQRLARAASPARQDAAVWRSCAEAFLAELNQTAAGGIDAVAVTGNMHAMLPYNINGEPLTEAWLWSDNACQAESDFLNSEYQAELELAANNLAAPVFTLPKILRFKAEYGELYRQTAAFLQSKEVIIQALTGKFVTDPVDASGSLLYDLRTAGWNRSLMAALKLDEAKFPEIYPSGGVCGYVSEAAAKRIGIKAGTPVVTGCGDLASAALGSNVNQDSLSLTLGTAGQLLGTGAAGQGHKLFGKLFVFAYAVPGQELYLGSMPGGGFSFEWLAKQHNVAIDELFRLAATKKITADLPLFMPYLLGRGAPYMDYTPCGGWAGLSARHNQADLFAGAVFGTLCALRQCADLMEALTGGKKYLILHALAAREAAVRNCAGALFNQQKFLPENTEASLLGAAILGMAAIKQYDSVTEAAQQMVKTNPLAVTKQAEAELLYQRFLKISAEITAFC